MSLYGIRQSKLDLFYDFIFQCLNSGWSNSKTVKAIYEKGYLGSVSNAFEHLCKIGQKENKCFVPPAICSNNDRVFKIQNWQHRKRKRLSYTRRGAPVYVVKYRIISCSQEIYL